MTVIIKLTRGQVALIDDIDAELSKLRWHALKVQGGFYAARTVSKKAVLLHREILERIIDRLLTKTEHVDHISGDKLDNRRNNLRIATRSQNLSNRGRPSNNTSGLKGAFWHKHNKKWMSSIGVNGRRKYLGYFDTPEEAHEAYCTAAQELHGAFANTGSPVVMEKNNA